MLNSRALTKIQSIILVTIIIVAAVSGVAVYVLDGGEEQSSETIKIGVCADLDSYTGEIWQGVVLAVEQINAEGGLLGRNLEVVQQDDDSYTPPFDSNIATNAMTRLITIDKADFLIANNILPSSTIYQDIAADHKKILFTHSEPNDELTQRVLDDYDRYKYFFRTGVRNETTIVKEAVDSLILCREHTGFNKVAFIYQYGFGDLAPSVGDVLGDYGFDVVLDESFGSGVLDFSSYFARAEAAGVEILHPLIIGPVGTSFVKEYYTRKSPMVIWGFVAAISSYDSWEITEGKCEHTTSIVYPVGAGYPLTSKVMPLREAYFERWGEQIRYRDAAAYDTVRFILADAIERAGTIETEAVIRALEETDVETSLARRFVFTSSHDIMIGEEGLNTNRRNLNGCPWEKISLVGERR